MGWLKEPLRRSSRSAGGRCSNSLSEKTSLLKLIAAGGEEGER